MGQLDDKVCIITGAGTGIGKGITLAYAEQGAKLVLASRNKDNLERAAHEVRDSFNTSVIVVPTDVTSEAQVIKLFEATLEEFGRVDVLVNNSGVFDGGPLEDLTLETWQKVVNVNLTGPFLCSREAMKIMKRQRAGRIINIGSISAQMPRMNSAPYTTTKHALVGLTKSTALEGRDFGVSASILHPGNTETENTRGGHAVNSDEPLMLASDLAAVAVTMAALPPYANMLESVVLPVTQKYIGRG
jgi:NAD(P)-dependent dehydrogenase (short-subunit alcohol dehydrogenase family)